MKLSHRRIRADIRTCARSTCMATPPPSVQAFQFGAAQGYQALADAVRELGADSPFTCLVPDLSGEECSCTGQ